ncbi:MAG: type III polyketide synthase, partial [Gammaproteobacteria bacterium]|nr:type III polyketide synthase [Gammaproteobacteria bacterium]
MKSSIVSIGTAVPANKLKQLEVAELISERLNLAPPKKRLLKSIYKATGIDTRHSVISDNSFLSSATKQSAMLDLSTAGRMKLYKEHALPLALSAIEQCMTAQKETRLSDITHVITVSCTGMYAPGLDIEIVHELQLR